jgi:hypothetical protein
MVRGIAFWVFICGFAVCAAVGYSIGGLAQMTIDNLQCQSSGYSDNSFLALCHNDRYGDYEHGALYYGIEPGLRDGIRTADVIFLGNSMGQAAFSSKTLRDYFHDRNVRFFVMGFGYGELSPFALAVWKKWRPAPKLLVINADPFFGDGVSAPGREALRGRPEYLLRLVLKMLFQRVHRAVCFIPWHACAERDRGTFRSAKTGQWSWTDPRVARRSIPVDPSAAKPLPQQYVDRGKAQGGPFLAAVGVRRDCIVFTATPNSLTNSMELADEMAAALNIKLILPATDGLSTMDGAHLNPASAEIWSSRLLEEIAPIMRECLARPPSRADAVNR